MAELLVRVVDKTHSDVFCNQTHTKRGDVIVACPDDWKWGKEELTNPEWIILIVPGLSDREAQAITTAEIGDRRHNPMLHARAHYLDLTKLSDKFDIQGIRVITITVEAFRAAKTRKLPVENPFVIN